MSFAGVGIDDIEPIAGDPTAIRGFAGELRGLTDRLATPRRAAHSLQQVRTAAVWEGAGFDAFLSLVEKLPKPSDIDNAVDRFEWLASSLVAFADVLEACQDDNARRRREFHEAVPPDLELTDEVRSTLGNLSHEATRTLERLDDASRDLRSVFDELDQLTVFAEPPPGYLERAGHLLDDAGRLSKEFVIGFAEGAWEMVKGLAVLAYHLNPVMLPSTARKVWQHRETIDAVAGFAWQNPGLFAREMGKAVVDWETFDKSPARWIGKMMPDLILALATMGGGAMATRVATSTVRVLRGVDHVVDAGQDLSRSARSLARARTLVDKGRVTLHDGVRVIDNLVDPAFLRRTIRVDEAGLLTEQRRVLSTGRQLVKFGTAAHRTLAKDTVTLGLYSRLRTVDRWVNGWPGMTPLEKLQFGGPGVLHAGGAFAEGTAISERAGRLVTAAEHRSTSDRGRPRSLAVDPPPRPPSATTTTTAPP